LPVFAFIVLLELVGGVWLLRTTYRRGIRRQRREWHEQGVPIVASVNALGPSFSATDNRDSSTSVAGQDEKYLGGFYSLQMSTAERGTALPGIQRKRVLLGFGLYVTSKRLFGVSQYRPSFDKKVGLMPQNLSPEENDKIIGELQATRLLEVGIDKIAKIELKIPPGLFRTGHLQISLVTGETKNIHVGRKQPGQQLRDLLVVFSPKVLEVS
jgi:hypothetical protein